ncbi:Germ cell-specific gene 1-like protein [Larimichthys crocea]|uniref:Uncharacterized protein n=1 Tax=Larimichthys crocea TaxID=215358 RepID=A0ACD3R6R0_LARCR|nr:Germ cell-specific gene 1-like protein [Larimichthys crocea]
MSSYWCVGKQKVPKPLCSPTKHSNCIPVPGVSNSSSIQFSWETGDDRFVFPTFHTGLFFTCEENIYTDAWGERDRLGESWKVRSQRRSGNKPRWFAWDGGSHDVHAGFSDDGLDGTRRLQASQLRLLLGVLRGLGCIYCLHVSRRLHSQQLHQEGPDGGTQAQLLASTAAALSSWGSCHPLLITRLRTRPSRWPVLRLLPGSPTCRHTMSPHRQS